MMLILPEYEVKLRECQHDDTQEGGEGSVHDGSEHVLQGQHCPLTPVAQTANKALEEKYNQKQFKSKHRQDSPVECGG